MARKGRGRLSSLQLLPPEVNHIVIWAAGELQANQRSQLDIYQEFSDKLNHAKRESRGELEFTIPSFSSFNRYSIGLDAMTRELNEAREMASAIAETFDPEESDDLTLIAVETIKGAVLALMRARSGKLETKDLKQLSEALRSALAAQNISTTRRQKVEAEYKKALGEVKDAVRKAGVSDETMDEINRRLGII